MPRVEYPSDPCHRRGRVDRPARRRLRRYAPAALLIGATLGAALSGGLPPPSTPVVTAARDDAPAPAQAASPASSVQHAWLLEPVPALSPGALSFRGDAPLGARFEGGAPRPDPVAAPPAPSPAPEEAPPAPPAPAAQIAPTTPLPLPRPPELTAPQAPRVASRQSPRQARAAGPQAAPEDNRSFIEKLFGVEPAPPPALGYAALGNPADVGSRGRLSPAPAPAVGEGTAVYDITARVVILPNGERLEAHSGLGESMDNPEHANLRMRGPTPPGTYHLTEREALFHGTRALRLHPVGGSAAIYGRAGLLTHPYLLGPSGASNGCVSFKDYDRFLQAYLRGEVRRLIVVAGSGGEARPGFARRLFGPSSAPAPRGDT